MIIFQIIRILLTLLMIFFQIIILLLRMIIFQIIRRKSRKNTIGTIITIIVSAFEYFATLVATFLLFLFAFLNFFRTVFNFWALI